MPRTISFTFINAFDLNSDSVRQLVSSHFIGAEILIGPEISQEVAKLASKTSCL